MPHEDEMHTRPLYVVVAGTAVASVGFSVSILAACLQWLLPELAAVAPARGTKPRRRKALGHHRRRISLPVNLTPVQITPIHPSRHHRHSIAATTTPSTPINNNPNRRVYFADSPRSVSFQLPISEEPSSPLPVVFNPATNVNMDGSPRSSSSTLVSSPPAANRRVSQIKDSGGGSELESDNNNSPSKRFPPLRLPKFMDIKRRRLSREESNTSVITVDSIDAAPVDLFGPISSTSTWSEEETPSSSRPHSLISILNNSPTARILSLPVIPEPGSSRSSSPGRPARTQPYDYPYFASPPRRTSSQHEAPKPVPPDNKRTRSYPMGAERKAS